MLIYKISTIINITLYQWLEGYMHRTNTPKYNFPSLDLLFELGKQRMSDQMDQINALDTKANFIIGSATTLLSAALVLQAVILTIQKSSSSQTTSLAHTGAINSFFYCSSLLKSGLQIIPILTFFVVYLILMVVSFFAYRLRAYQLVPDLEIAYQKYINTNPIDTKAIVFRAMVEVYKNNKSTIQRKVFWLSTAFIFLGIEAAILVLVLLVQTTC